MYIRVGQDLYPALYVNGNVQDSKWDYRSSMAIELEMDYADAVEVFADGTEWSIVDDDEQQYDYNEYNIAGDITDHRDGTLTVKMGKITDLEEAYELLYGGE